MVSNPRSYKSKLLGLIIVAFLVLPTPMLFVDARSTTHQNSTVIDPVLTSKIHTAEPGERLPIVAYFSDGSNPDEMGVSIRSMGLVGIEIRHIFHLIPAVSLYATGTEIQALSELHVKLLSVQDRRRPDGV